MKKIRNLITAMVALIVLTTVIGCNEQQRNISNAESIIKNFMYQSIPDFDSYEVVSTMVDSLYDCPELHADIVDLTHQYADISQQRVAMEDNVYTLENSEPVTEREKIRFLQSQLSGYEILAISSRIQKHKQRLSDARRKLTDLKEMEDSIQTLIQAKTDSIDTKKFIGYKAIQKYRVSNNGVKVFATHCFIIDKNFDKIITDWVIDDAESNPEDL